MQRTRFRALLVVTLLAEAALTVWVVVSRSGTGDYQVGGAAGGDNAGPPLMALVHGHLAALPRLQTVMGPVSLLWRVPFVGLATALGAGPHLGYEVGAAACLMPLTVLVGWIACRARTVRQLGIAATAGLLLTLSPPVAGSVVTGHPEEVLTTALAVAAVLAAQADRRLLAPVLLGLAVGSKEWALLAAPAVLLALPGSRLRAGAVALGISALACAPLPLLDPSAWHRADVTIGPITGITQLSVWWLSSPATAAGHRLPLGLTRIEATGAVVLLAGALASLAGWALRHRGADRDGAAGPAVDPMALLTLIMLVRCLADPADLPYYLVAVTLALTVWEAGSLRRFPIAAVLAWATQALCVTAAAPFAVRPAALHGAPAVLVFLGAGALLGIELTVAALRPRAPVTGARSRPRPRLRRPSTSLGSPVHPA